MAVKWAIANGNWNTGSTWNDNVIPTSADEVYLNGCTVTVSSGATLNANFISNGGNADYGIVEGGHLYFSGYNGCTINANLIQKGSNILSDGTWIGANSWMIINGNITNENAFVFQYDGVINLSISVFGDIEIGMSSIFRTNNNLNLQFSLNITSPNYFKNPNNMALFAHLQIAFTMTSCTLTGSYFENFNKGNGALTTLTVNVTDYLSLSTNLSVTTANFNGTLKCNSNVLMTGTTLNINGVIEYINTQNNVGVRFVTMNIGNRESFVWHDISVPRINPFLIVTDWDLNNQIQYPAEDRVVEGTPYAFNRMVGRFAVDYPPEPVVLKDYVYDSGNMTGTLETISVQADYPNEDDVRFDVPFDFGNKSGKCHVPLPEDVREGVPVDVNAVGTLIPSSGGDRLRIADFGYYTRSTSITYIVDLTESDKPAFADCEKIVLLSLFPTLDLNNIPDKFFDDLFVQFLRYRLLVEYYRGISVNSKFTPSEPTTEIVNYANTKCEYWLNTANLFLQLWGEKYPNSVRKDRIIL